MWALYRITVDDLTTPAMVRVFCDLLERIPYESAARSRAEQAGDEKLYGWSAKTAALACIVEELRATQLLIAHIVGGNKKIAETEPYQASPDSRLEALKNEETQTQIKTLNDINTVFPGMVVQQ